MASNLPFEDMRQNNLYLEALTNDKAFEKAYTKGLIPVLPDAHTVMIDIDSPTLPEDFEENKEMLNRFYEIESEIITTSVSGNLHVYLRMKEPLLSIERIALAAALGSDPKREIFSFVRNRAGLPGYASLLFETPAEAEKVSHLEQHRVEEKLEEELEELSF